jgi:hypothetical protein
MKSTLTTSSITRFAFDNISPPQKWNKNQYQEEAFQTLRDGLPSRQLGVKPSPGWRRGRGEEEQKLKEH